LYFDDCAANERLQAFRGQRELFQRMQEARKKLIIRSAHLAKAWA
jgi:hypothetical protein